MVGCVQGPRVRRKDSGDHTGREGRSTERNVEAADEDVTDVRDPRERVVGRVGGGSESTPGGGHFVVRETEERELLDGYVGGSWRRVGRVENGIHEEIR